MTRASHSLASQSTDMAKPVPRLSPADIAAIIQTAWDDPPPYHRG